MMQQSMILSGFTQMKDICQYSSQIMQKWRGIVEDPYLPPTIAHTLVRKCKNETCSSVKVTCKMLFQYKGEMRWKKNTWRQKTINKTIDSNIPYLTSVRNYDKG